MFIVLESIDGGGKGRQRIEVETFFSAKGVNIKSAGFPDHSNSIWKDFLQPALHKKINLTPGAWFSAFALEKFLWQEELSKYQKDPNNLFIADGYYTTTLVYQCILNGVPELDFGVNFAEVLGIVKPDLTIYLDVNPATARARKDAEEGKEIQDMYESDIQKQEEIRSAFHYLIENKVWCDWNEIDGNGSIQEVRDQIIEQIELLR
jgi:thymidylate kinase